jgi:hypothetical protein
VVPFVPIAGLLACSSPGAHSTPPNDAAVEADATGTTDAGPHVLAVTAIADLGGFSAPSTVVGRDGTTSASVGGQLVWTFGDTFLTKPNAIDGATVLSATAGWSTTLDPLRLSEPLDDAGLPGQLIPYTSDEIAKNKADPSDGVALWPGPVVAVSGTEAVVFFQHVLRSGCGFSVDAIGTAHVTKGSTVATRDPAFLFQGSDPTFSNAGGTVDGGYVYLYDCELALGFECKVARAPLTQLTERSAYTFWNGSSFTSNASQAAWFIQGVSSGISIERNPWLGRWLAVSSSPGSNDILLKTADSLTGPFGEALVVPSTSNGIVTSDAGTNYLAKEHVELQSAGGQEIVIGYAHPLPNFGGDPHLARLTLK